MANPFTFGGVDLTQHLRGLTVERSVLPSVEVSTVDVPSADGLLLNGRRLKPLEITIRGALMAYTAAEVAAARHALGRVLNHPGTRRLVLPDEPGLYYNALVSGSSELSRAYERPTATITFLVPEACAWSSELRTRNLSAGTSVVVDVGGNAETWPTLDFTTSSTTVTLSRGTTEHEDRSVTYKLTGLASGRSYTADMAAQRTWQGSTEVFPGLGYDYFAIGPGETELRLTGAGGTLAWRERWV